MIRLASLQRAATVAAALLCLTAPSHAVVSLGIDQLEKSNFAILHGKRVGLVTNPSGADSRGRSAIDVLAHGRGFKLVKLFGPEHGIYGVVKAGTEFGDTHDRKTGLPVYALYNSPSGDHRHPTPQMFAGLDCVVYDVQDLGNRSYTFISTLGYVMDEAARDHVQVIVLDRPNPLGGVRIEGPRLKPADQSFVGLYNIPLVYGLTPGELAQWINAHFLRTPCNLKVVPMTGWTRSMVWEDTHLRWIPTSPNIPTIRAARGYTATGFLGEIGIESGVGGPAPFQAVAGTGWDTRRIAAQFNALEIPGVHASPYRYYAGRDYDGVYLAIDPRNAGNLSAISFYAISVLQRTIRGFSAFARTKGEQREMFDKVTGDRGIRAALMHGASPARLVRSWNAGVTEWAEERLPYLIYGESTSPRAVLATSDGASSSTGDAP